MAYYKQLLVKSLQVKGSYNSNNLLKRQVPFLRILVVKATGLLDATLKRRHVSHGVLTKNLKIHRPWTTR